MDTGFVVHAIRVAKSPDTVLEIKAWNASDRAISGLSLRLHLDGAPGQVEEFGLRALGTQKFGPDGLAYSANLADPSWTTPPAALTPGCKSASCPYQLDLPLGDVRLAPLEGISLELTPARLVNGTLEWTAPSKLPGVWDWSFSNLGGAVSTIDSLGIFSTHRATRIEAFSNGTKIWGNARGESNERPSWPVTDLRRASFGSLIRVPSDTAPVAEIDARNRNLGNWLVNQAGYRRSDVQAGKARVLRVGTTSWSVIDSLGRALGSGTTQPLGFTVSGQLMTKQYRSAMEHLLDTIGLLRQGSASELRLPTNLPAGGPYRIASPTDTSAAFFVDEDIYGKIRDASMRFLGIQRSGNSSSWFRAPSFSDDPVPGGWYDCGDRLKHGFTIGYAMEVLGELAATHPELDPDRTSWLQSLETPDGVPDLRRELRHGAEYALASWDQSGKSPANMITVVGDVRDHQAWTDDRWVGSLPTSLGGPGARGGQKMMSGAMAGSWAAGLAFAARLHTASDPDFSTRALEAARALYAWGKANPATTGDMFYPAGESAPKLALAAVALLWTTRDTIYLHDLVANDSIAPRKPYYWTARAGWFGKGAGAAWPMFKTGWMLDWQNTQPLVLHSFQRLILSHPDTALRYGVRTGDYDSLREAVLAGMMDNLVRSGQGQGTIALERGNLQVDTAWGFPIWPLNWGFTRYLSGNLAEMELYVDMVRGFEARPSSRFPAGTAFKADSVEAAVVKGMDYILGQNPWEMSFLTGIGSRNLNHPHHSAANPEGRNIPATNWQRRAPVGALMGGGRPETPLLRDEWEKYDNSESCIDFTASFLVPATLLSQPPAADPTGLRRGHGLRTLAAPRVGWDPRSGTLRWSGASDGIRWDVLDARGRILSAGSTSEASGGRILAIPPGIAVLRWTSGGHRGTQPLLRVPR